MHAIADALRDAGHTVHTDFFEGRTFASLDDGFAALKAKGRTPRTSGPTSSRVPCRRTSSTPASRSASCPRSASPSRPGARGAVFLESCAPVSAFGEAWPAGVPVQVHGMDADPFFAGDGDVDNARELVAQADDGELFVYSGDAHLFTDSSLPSSDPAATASVLSRMLAFLGRV